MRTQRTTVLAGIAALALLAGTSLVSAQEKPDQNATPQAKRAQAAQQMDKNAPAEKMGQSIQERNKAAPMAPKSAQMNNESKAAGKNKAAAENKATTRNRTAQSEQHKSTGKKSAMTRTEPSKTSRTAAERNRVGRQNTAQDRNSAQERQKTAQDNRDGMKGLQGNASGMNVQLSDQQRGQIRTTVLNGRNAARIGNVNFDVAVGTAIPHGFHVVPVPTTLVRIEPRWRGFLYFVYNDEVVIVNPRDMRIVAVVMV